MSIIMKHKDLKKLYLENKLSTCGTKDILRERLIEKGHLPKEVTLNETATDDPIPKKDYTIKPWTVHNQNQLVILRYLDLCCRINNFFCFLITNWKPQKILVELSFLLLIMVFDGWQVIFIFILEFT